MLVGLTNTEGPEDFHINDWMIHSGFAVTGKMVCMRPPNFPFRQYLAYEYQLTHKTDETVKSKKKVKLIKRNSNNATKSNLAFYKLLLRLHGTPKSGKSLLTSDYKNSEDSLKSGKDTCLFNMITTQTGKGLVDTFGTNGNDNDATQESRKFGTNYLKELLEAHEIRKADFNDIDIRSNAEQKSNHLPGSNFFENDFQRGKNYLLQKWFQIDSSQAKSLSKPEKFQIIRDKRAQNFAPSVKKLEEKTKHSERLQKKVDESFKINEDPIIDDDEAVLPIHLRPPAIPERNLNRSDDALLYGIYKCEELEEINWSLARNSKPIEKPKTPEARTPEPKITTETPVEIKPENCLQSRKAFLRHVQEHSRVSPKVPKILLKLRELQNSTPEIVPTKKKISTFVENSLAKSEEVSTRVLDGNVVHANFISSTIRMQQKNANKRSSEEFVQVEIPKKVLKFFEESEDSEELYGNTKSIENSVTNRDNKSSDSMPLTSASSNSARDTSEVFDSSNEEINVKDSHKTDEKISCDAVTNSFKPDELSKISKTNDKLFTKSDESKRDKNDNVFKQTENSTKKINEKSTVSPVDTCDEFSEKKDTKLALELVRAITTENIKSQTANNTEIIFDDENVEYESDEWSSYFPHLDPQISGLENNKNLPQNVERNYSSSENSKQEIARKNSLFSDIREEKSDDNLDREMEKNTCEYSDSDYSEPEIIKETSSSSGSSSDKSDDDDDMNRQLLGRKFVPNDAPNYTKLQESIHEDSDLEITHEKNLGNFASFEIKNKNSFDDSSQKCSSILNEIKKSKISASPSAFLRLDSSSSSSDVSCDNSLTASLLSAFRKYI